MKRFWDRTTKVGDCVVWTGSHTADGYGNLNHEGRTVYAHRLAYEMTIGPIPDGLVIDHLCRNRSCVNPAHLEPVTSRTNVLRGKTVPAANAAKTHCPHGHEYTPDNIYWAGNTRRCAICVRERMRQRRKAA